MIYWQANTVLTRQQQASCLTAASHWCLHSLWRTGCELWLDLLSVCTLLHTKKNMADNVLFVSSNSGRVVASACPTAISHCTCSDLITASPSLIRMISPRHHWACNMNVNPRRVRLTNREPGPVFETCLKPNKMCDFSNNIINTKKLPWSNQHDLTGKQTPASDPLKGVLTENGATPCTRASQRFYVSIFT